MATSEPTTTEQSGAAAYSKPVKTAILMINMGGPNSEKLEDVRKFLSALFSDRDIIEMPLQGFLGPIMSKLRAPKLKAKLDKIGGDPVRSWTERQGSGIAEELDKISPSTEPHKVYTCSRYSEPNIDQAVEELERDHAERVVLLSEFPQFCCGTTGSSLNDIARYCIEMKRHMD